MSYCPKGAKPIITYQFGNEAKSKRRYQSDYAPIEIETKSLPVDAGANYDRQGYQISYFSKQTSPSAQSTIVVDYEVIFYEGANNFDPYRGYYLTYLTCDKTYYTLISPCDEYRPKAFKCRSSSHGLYGSTVTVDKSVRCPKPNKERCSIQILYNNLIIFQDQGDCPCIYTVQCGNCAESQVECKTNSYPGYCCVDCAEIKAGIAEATAMVRSINHG